MSSGALLALAAVPSAKIDNEQPSRNVRGRVHPGRHDAKHSGSDRFLIHGMQFGVFQHAVFLQNAEPYVVQRDYSR